MAQRSGNGAPPRSVAKAAPMPRLMPTAIDPLEIVATATGAAATATPQWHRFRDAQSGPSSPSIGCFFNKLAILRNGGRRGEEARSRKGGGRLQFALKGSKATRVVVRTPKHPNPRVRIPDGEPLQFSLWITTQSVANRQRTCPVPRVRFQHDAL